MDLINGKIYEFYKQEKHCDLVLICEQDGTRIATHRLVVIAASEYFCTMLTKSWKEKDMQEISIGCVSGSILKKLIEYCYTGKFSIYAGNVNDVLKASTMFEFPNVVEKCADYLKCHINIDTCLTTWATAKIFYLNEVINAAFKYISKYFLSVVNSREFKELKSEELFEILNNTETAVQSEQQIFDSIFKWIKFDVENRRNEFEMLMLAVRMSKISDTFLMHNVLKFVRFIGRSEYISEAWEYAVNSKENSVDEKPRKYVSEVGIIFNQQMRQYENN